MNLDDVLARVRSGTTTVDDADWLHWHIIGLQSRIDCAEGELKGVRESVGTLKHELEDALAQANLHRKDNELMLRVLAKERQKVCDLRDKLAAWDAWEHAWVFGGDAEYPGSPGVTDPRETLDALVRMAVVMRIEEADDA